jgi:predicted nuclease of restriction endonuclease-like (RecB) superfamily
VTDETSIRPADYTALLSDLKARVEAARIRATLAVNRELVGLYWDIGRTIAERQAGEGWGRSVIGRLASDLQAAFPDTRGFSTRNLWRMRAFYLAWSAHAQILPQPLAELPWGHNAVLLERLDSVDLRLWYAEHARQAGWSRNVLEMQIETELHRRQGKATTNFAERLPAARSDLAQQLLKDPYLFGFLGLEEEAQEREVERALMRHLRRFLLELGVGFAFVGNQYRLEVGGREFFIDMLFYHLGLSCFVVLELKGGAFEPEYAGKLNFYLSAVDEQVRRPERDGPSIGLLLCRTKNEIVAEYALRDISKPMGVSAYQLTESLPDALRGKLPTVEELEAELASDVDGGGPSSDEGEDP